QKDCENPWEWDECFVTIPVSLGEINIDYIAHFIHRPGFTVTYYDTDAKTVMGSQVVEKDTPIKEFGVDFTTAVAEDGYKVRGWYLAPANARKATVEDIVSDHMSLYARASEIETASTHKKYEFLLNDASFDPADHEAFNTENGYFHDTTHGWAFKNGDVITLLTGPKAAVSIALCRYGYGTNIKVTDAKGNEVATVPAKSTTETDGEVVAFQYEGDPGLLTLTFESDGELYIHSVKIMNNAEVNYESEGNWYFVKPGDAQSLLDVIEAVCAVNADRDADRSFIFVPDGVYDLREKVLTNISGHNISLIGQSMEKTIIRNAPHYTVEGIAQTATLMNTGTNLYMQDLTIQNALDYYAAQDAGLQGGRAVAFWDKGINTAAKNVTLLSYQDTYYTNNVNGTYYWETSDIHGTVDFFCGEGTMFMTNSIITVEKRKQDGSGECTITAPSTKAGDKYGYVFENCTVVNHAAKYNFGRAWSNEPRCAYINTTLNDDKLNSNRWTAGGMNVAAKAFVEFNTKDAEGNVVSPESHVMTFTKGDNVNKMETILTAEQAAEYTVDKVFPEWNPAALCVQIAAPNASLTDGVISWPSVEGASAYAIFKNGELAAVVTDGDSYVVDDPKADWSIRSANAQGGLGEAAQVKGSSSVNAINVDTEGVYFNLQGIRVDNPLKGQVYILNGKKIVK
ncbi:MAG: pectin esterase, partial [Muribaculaceae bacterium]|nr:pectin esterase [Muribaculaceae bacterium]